jgi:uncharacterized MAPEG superfamily protein
MNLLTHAKLDSVLLAYSFTSVLLCLNLLLLWIGSGVLRANSGVAANPEDGARFNVPVSAHDPPAVARVLRAHRNAEAVIYPFLLLGLVYLLAGGTITFAAPIFVIFVAARLAHSGFYLAAKQPGRTVSFAISLLATFALLAGDVWFTFHLT